LCYVYFLDTSYIPDSYQYYKSFINMVGAGDHLMPIPAISSILQSMG